MRLVSSLSVALLGATAVACGATPDPGPEASSTAATAIIAVERVSGPGDAVRPDAVSARFIRVRQGVVDDSALRIAGVAEDLPPLGTCAAPTTGAATFGRNVELLDVGAVTLAPSASPIGPTAAFDARSTVLSPRTMPDPAGVLSGVFYSSRSADAFAAGAPLSLRAMGGADIEAFALNVNTPHDLGDVHVASTAAGLEVEWDADAADVRDFVYLDVLTPAARSVARCAVIDGGHFIVPAGSIGALDEGQVAVHRIHKEPFRTRSIEPGEVRFDLAKIVAFRR